MTNESSIPQAEQIAPLLRRSLGAKFSLGSKFFVILFLALFMSISGFFVEALTTERANNHGVTAAVAGQSAPPSSVFGVKLVDSYRSMHRALHYITLFLGLVFLTYFLFEIHTGKRVHLAQYALVGVAQTIFYLLLLSFAEHLGFDFSFLIAGGATVALFTINTEWVFRSRALALRALAVFTALYGFIYVLLRVEAYALLVGAITSFIGVAAAMYFTRNVNWYGSSTAREPVSASLAHHSWLE